MRSRPSPDRPHWGLPIVLVLIVLLAGCSAFETSGTAPTATTQAPSTTTTASTTPNTETSTTLQTTTSTAVLTDRTPTTRLELHPALNFTGRITVHLNGDEVYNQTITEDNWSPEIDLSDEFHDDSGYRVRVTASTQNETNVWDRGIRENEGYELEILGNSTIQVEMRIVG